jgi:hypothetical protein
MAEQVSNPLCVFDVGLSPWHLLDVQRIGDDDL